MEKNLVLTQEEEDVLSFMCQPSTSEHTSSCIVQTFAGCGKTTLLAALAKRRFEKGLGSMLLLTYSAELKTQTRAMAQLQDGLFVESWHSLIRNILWVGHECKTEKDIQAYLQLKTKPTPHIDFLTHVTLIAVDEMQDMNQEFYQVFQQLRSFFQNRINFIGVGDFFQWLFATLHGSSTQYMCDAEDYFPADRFARFPLSTSFRLTKQMCTWINNNLNPNKLQHQYPHCWAKYGSAITRFWGTGIQSAKCELCATVHAKDQPHANYSTKSIENLNVVVYEVNSYQELLPRSLLSLAQSGAHVLVNGRQTERYSCRFPNVTTPFAFKGCETDEVIVVGYDSFTEELSRNNNKHDLEEWPLACFCQMYVSCTRGRTHLYLVRSKSRAMFFTSRPDQWLLTSNNSKLVEKDEEFKKNNGTRMISRLFQFVPEDTSLDNMVTTTSFLLSSCSSLQPSLKLPPNVAPGCVPGTVLRHFGRFYERAVILATYLHYCKQNFQLTDWTLFMREHILRDQSSAVSSQWKADDVWCQKATDICISLLDQAQFQVVTHEKKCMETFEYMHLQGVIDLFVLWAGMVFVSFESCKIPSVFMRHRAMTTYLLYRKRNPQYIAMNCYILNPVTNQIYQVQLQDSHQDYYIGEAVRRKNWQFLLEEQQFSLYSLFLRGVPIPESKLQKAIQEECANTNYLSKKRPLSSDTTSSCFTPPFMVC